MKALSSCFAYSVCRTSFFFFQAEDGIRDATVTGVRRVLFRSVLIESASPIKDQTVTSNDMTPVQAQRAWDRQAEENVGDRLERMGLIAPRGEVDKVLETVVNNLEVTNNLDIQPEVRCRVLLTSTLESFTIGHTIVLSRGLIAVLPDE